MEKECRNPCDPENSKVVILDFKPKVLTLFKVPFIITRTVVNYDDNVHEDVLSGDIIRMMVREPEPHYNSTPISPK